MKEKICGVLAVIAFIYIFGVVGAIEQNMVTLASGAVRCFAGIAAFYGFGKAAGVMV